MVEVPLRARDGSLRAVALVDDEDAERVLAHRWYLSADGYAVRVVRIASGRATLRLHRVVLGIEPGDPREVDHRDHNKLDCRRANLRPCVRALNGQNRQGGYGRSRYRGVAWHKRAGKWQAYATLGRRRTHLGYFAREEDAGAVAAAFRAEHMPFSAEAAA